MGETFAHSPCGGGMFGDPNVIRSTDRLLDANSREHETRIETPKGPITNRWRRDPDVATTWTLKHYIESDEDLERFLSIPYEFQPPDMGEIRRLENRMGESGVLLFGIGDALGHVAPLFEFQDFIMRFMEDPEPIHDLLARAARMLEDIVDYVDGKVKDAVFRLWGPEYAGPPLMNPAKSFEPLVLRYDAPLVQKIKNSGNIAVIHCHGKLKELLDPMLDMGADVLEPLELLPVSTADVTLVELKEKLGGRMALMGGMQAMDLDNGTPELVRERVRSLLSDGMPGGGFTLIPTSTPLNLPLPEAIVDNYRAAFETVEKYGWV